MVNRRDVDGDRSTFGQPTITLRLRTLADLASARRQLYDGFTGFGVTPDDADDAVLAVCELLTNALEAADVDSVVTAIASVSDAHRQPLGTRRIEVEIINSGQPLSGIFEVDGSTVVASQRVRGRGLVLAARMGSVTVEGLVGGTRARFRRVIDDRRDVPSDGTDAT